MARMDATMDMSSEMRQWISPNLIEANYILSLSRQELEQVINQELDSNPALETEADPICPVCGGVLDGSFCATCLISQQHEAPHESFEDFPEQLYTAPVTREDDDEFDPMSLVGSNVSMRDQIAIDLATLLPDRLIPIAEYLLDCLDDRGFVDADLADIAARFETHVDDVELALCAIQAIAPVGVAARDLRECLLLQIAYLRRQD